MFKSKIALTNNIEQSEIDKFIEKYRNLWNQLWMNFLGIQSL